MANWKKAKDIGSLFKMIEKDIEVDSSFILSAIAKKVYNILYDATEKWYEAKSESPFYERTYEFINSLTITPIDRDSNGWNIGVYFDPSKMTQGLNSAGYWQQHEDRIYLSEIINNGWEYRQDGSHALDETIKYLESSGFFDFLEKEFKGLGYKII